MTVEELAARLEQIREGKAPPLSTNDLAYWWPKVSVCIRLRLAYELRYTRDDELTLELMEQGLRDKNAWVRRRIARAIFLKNFRIASSLLCQALIREHLQSTSQYFLMLLGKMRARPDGYVLRMIYDRFSGPEATSGQRKALDIWMYSIGAQTSTGMPLGSSTTKDTRQQPPKVSKFISFWLLPGPHPTARDVEVRVVDARKSYPGLWIIYEATDTHVRFHEVITHLRISYVQPLLKALNVTPTIIQSHSGEDEELEFDYQECVGRLALVDVVLVDRPGGMRYNYTDNPRPPKPSFTGRPLRDEEELPTYQPTETKGLTDQVSDGDEEVYSPW